VAIQEFLSSIRSDGSGAGNGSGSGYGKGYGGGSGAGNGAGDEDGTGYGAGNGGGFGFGGGYGHGGGNGDGDGFGFGFGDGYGRGDGNGSGLLKFDGYDVHRIDGINTIITTAKLGLAKGFILHDDLTLSPTYIAVVDGFCAHGETARMAFEDAKSKAYEEKSDEERVAEFLSRFEKDRTYSAKDLMIAHRSLTGSCEQGCMSFMKQRGIVETDMFTVEQFIETTKKAYASDVIAQLEKAWRTK
jgi:hypothetical protein